MRSPASSSIEVAIENRSQRYSGTAKDWWKLVWACYRPCLRRTASGSITTESPDASANISTAPFMNERS